MVYGELAAGEVEALSHGAAGIERRGHPVQVPEGCEELVVGLAAAAARMSSSGGCMRAVQSIWMNTMGGSTRGQHALVDATLGVDEVVQRHVAPRHEREPASPAVHVPAAPAQTRRAPR
jgi:hypothetical protein